MDIWHAVVLGVVEGLTEYLPVSSTGHLILVSGLLGLDEPALKPAVNNFEIVMQGGAILAVLGLYRRRVGQIIAGLSVLPGARGDTPHRRDGRRLAGNLLLAFMPAGILGITLGEHIEQHLFAPPPVLAALALGGVYMIALDRFLRRRPGLAAPGANARPMESLTPADALLIGLMQSVSLWPGTSRALMSITAGMLVGLDRRSAAEFSFLLALPTLGGAVAYKIARDLWRAYTTGAATMFESLGLAPTLAGIAVATLSAAGAVRWLVGFLNRHGLEPFGWYRLVLTAVLVVLAMTGVVRIVPTAP